LTVYRVDGEGLWDGETLKLIPVETRYVDISTRHSKRPFYMHVYCPAYSVVAVRLEGVTEGEMLAGM
jgi:hypothetical protein